MITAIEMLEKHGINTEKLGIEAEYSFKNILNAMEEYRKDHSSSGYLDALLDCFDCNGQGVVKRYPYYSTIMPELEDVICQTI